MTDIRTREQASALAWSVTAMSDALSRLAAASAASLPQAVAGGHDAAMTRHHPAAYGRALAALDPAARKAIEGSLAGLRFIRSQLGYSADPADFIQPPPAPGSGAAQWTWSAIALPPPPRGKAREASPYREYRTQLAGRSVTQILEQAAGFLARAHATVIHSRNDRAPPLPREVRPHPGDPLSPSHRGVTR
jgi:hypothetical protein